MEKVAYFNIVLLIFLIFSCNNPVIIESPGCTDKNACNYDANFDLDDGSCEFPIDNHDCEGNCVVDLDCAGICGGSAENLGCGCEEEAPDECGICGGDNSTCAVVDCAGLIDGAAVVDECGVCDGDGPVENYDCDGNCIVPIDCAGICGGPAIEDECGICDGEGTAIYDCEGNCVVDLDCTGECGGSAVLDVCGVCDGNIVNLSDCACPSGEIDACGICDGPGAIYECGCEDIQEGFCDCGKEIVIDCDGNCCDPNWPFGSTGLDACYRIDVCGNCGDFLSANECQDDCKDCNETCGGDAIEDCAGECGGSATEDCAGICGGPAIEDECDVCSSENFDSQYVLVWEDEFEGDELDVEKWNIEEWPTGAFNEEEQAYTDATDNIYLNNGLLHIRALRETYDPDGNGEADALYTSGRITSKHKGDWQYAKVEALAKVPVGDGTWPAIWMLPTENIYGDWPSSGEIDIMEYVGKETNLQFDIFKAHSSLHNSNYFQDLSNSGQTSSLNVNGVHEFHLYSMIWSKNIIIFYVDGEEVLIYNNLDSGFEQWPFDQHFFLVLNLAIGGTWGGTVEPEIFPVEFEIDYVRVFQKSCGL
jgi:beta-glucanase (GH16 family)